MLKMQTLTVFVLLVVIPYGLPYGHVAPFADVTFSAVNAINSIQCDKSVNSLFAYSAHTAFNAQHADDCINANDATFAADAQYAVTSFYSKRTSYAKYAKYANEAEVFGKTKVPHFSGKELSDIDEAIFSMNADDCKKLCAVSGDKSKCRLKKHAVKGDIAVSSLHCSYSIYAVKADKVTNAKYSQVARNAKSCETARKARRAINSQKATMAMKSTVANFASKAKFAWHRVAAPKASQDEEDAEDEEFSDALNNIPEIKLPMKIPDQYVRREKDETVADAKMKHALFVQLVAWKGEIGVPDKKPYVHQENGPGEHEKTEVGEETDGNGDGNDGNSENTEGEEVNSGDSENGENLSTPEPGQPEESGGEVDTASSSSTTGSSSSTTTTGGGSTGVSNGQMKDAIGGSSGDDLKRLDNTW